MKLLIFKNKTIHSSNIEDYDNPTSITQFRFLGIVLYESRKFEVESNSEIILLNDKLQ